MVSRVLCCFLLLRAFVFAETSDLKNLFQKISSKNHLEIRLPPEFQQKLLCQHEDSNDTEKVLNKATSKSVVAPDDEIKHEKHSIPPPNSPANDLCANAIPIGAGTFVAETFTASKDGSSGCQANSSSPDIW